MRDKTPNLQADPFRKKGLSGKQIVGGIVGALVVTAAIAGITAVNMVSAAQEAKISASRSAEASQSAEASKRAAKAKAQADLDRSTRELAAAMEQAVADAEAKEQKEMEAAGWTYVSDHLYYVVAPPDSVSCGTLHQCAGFSVVSQNPNGCPGGIYLEASFLTSDNVSVGRDSQYTAALSQGQQANFKLYDRSGAGTAVDVTSMRCT